MSPTPSLAARAVALTLLLIAGCGDDDSPGTDASVVCSAHADCDDGVYCNGVEQCLPGDPAADPSGCVSGATSCMPTQVCREADRVCETVCAVEPDADGDGHQATECGGDDCDDADAERNPSAVEICDAEGRDEDCRPDTLGDRDLDGDGLISNLCCNGADCGLDCNDNDRAASPGSPEVCDGADNDCDGAVDEGLTLELFRDADHDGVGAAGSETLACPGAPGYASAAGDCDDTVASVRPTAPEICDGEDNDCDGVVDEDAIAIPWYVDRDGDGWGIVSAADPSVESCVPPEGRAIRPGDCDDDDATVNPEAAERCNGRDDDCNGRADYWIAVGDGEDDDRDGLPDERCDAPTADCDDRDPNTRDGAPELCDGADNDCDGTVDEGADEIAWYADADGDGFGAPDDMVSSCMPIPGRVTNADDCDDTNRATRPTAADACGGQPAIDDDCDGTVDEGGNPSLFYTDEDRDGWGTGDPLFSCLFDVGRARRSGDCDDADPRVSPGRLDDCAGLTGVDDDCDGRTDESPAARVFYADADGDGYGAGAPMSGCTQPTGTVTRSGDCDDAEPGVNPLVPDDCGSTIGRDDDCDGSVDEAALAMTYYADTDGDGYGNPGAPLEACGAPTGYVADARDCDDGAAGANPAGTELCDDLSDNDCDGALDCDDPDCAGSCARVVVVSGDGQSAPIHEPFAMPLVARVETLGGTPLPGRTVRLTSGVHVPESGDLRTTDAAGEVSFPVRAGLAVGSATVELASAGATTVSADLTGIAPTPGTLFSALNGPRYGIVSILPQKAWLTSGTDGWSDVVSAPDGTLYVGWDGSMQRIDPAGEVTALGFYGGAGPAEGRSVTEIGTPTRNLIMAYDAAGDRLLFEQTRRVWAVDLATGLLELVAGNGSTGAAGDGGPAVNAQLSGVSDLVYSANGLLWVIASSRIRYVDAAGIIHLAAEFPHGGALQFLGAAPTAAPAPGPGDAVYVLGRCNPGNFDCVVRLQPDGGMTLVAGGGSDATSNGIPATDALIDAGMLVTLPSGDLLLAEESHARVRRITPAGTIETVVGSYDMPGDSGDGGPGTSARLGAIGDMGLWQGHAAIVDTDANALRVLW
ncbi:MAG: hypothetical protein JJ863_09465 [Deltaproteobacteria bacterium]|nr:hypothetical protein [Deltaproteobacteria bacterium]